MISFPFFLLNKVICLTKGMKNIAILHKVNALDQDFKIHIPTTKHLFSGLRHCRHNEKIASKFSNMAMGFLMIF